MDAINKLLKAVDLLDGLSDQIPESLGEISIFQNSADGDLQGSEKNASWFSYVDKDTKEVSIIIGMSDSEDAFRIDLETLNKMRGIVDFMLSFPEEKRLDVVNLLDSIE